MDIGQNIKAQVELFHLLFLEQLSLKLDKRLYALKGGCNLRFFLNSIRYSEDIDFDVHTVAVATLENMVSKILLSTPFKQVLTTRSIVIVDFTTPKQTETTQRWKIKLKVGSRSLDLNTKIEFSRRQSTTTSILEPISKKLNIDYNLRPIYVSHYPINIALQQKVLALIMRTETQARDIFDIELLLQQGANLERNDFNTIQLETAIDNAMGITFMDFKSQVVSYLEDEYIKQYSDQNIWQNILERVTAYIGGINETNQRI